MTHAKTLVWFRQDLRLADNPALLHACEQGQILAVFILDDQSVDHQLPGGAGSWWLQQSLLQLSQACHNNLLCLRGNPAELLPLLAREYGCQELVWNRCYEPWQIRRDSALKQQLQNTGLKVQSFNGSLLWEPWQVLKKDGTPYRVFTPYYQKGCLTQPEPAFNLRRTPVVHWLTVKSAHKHHTDPIALALLPEKRWYQHWPELWDVSEEGAHQALSVFIKQRLPQYKHGRDIPSLQGTSLLSPYLHWGQLSPNQIWHQAKALSQDLSDPHLLKFLAELGWREFSYYLLYHFPDLPNKSFNPKFSEFQWLNQAEVIKQWQQGQTGIPIVDAGMRELWQTGYMHNRVRMITASLLVKNLRQHWLQGARWFNDCLLDADLASNSASWQWVAGCGADAAPYFRIFNPVLQGEKFDPQGAYVKQYCPELNQLPDKYIHSPWLAPESVLTAAGIELGMDYPRPVVDLKLSRQQALDAYSALPRAS